MSSSAVALLHDAICGGLAAAGFGVLYNVGFRTLPFCAASGAIALSVRAVALRFGLGLEASSFAAALTLGFAIQLLPSRAEISRNVLHVVGCIPMIPGVFAAKAILGLFAITQSSLATNDALIVAMESGLRVIFIVGALGTGLAIPSSISKTRIRLH